MQKQSVLFNKQTNIGGNEKKGKRKPPLKGAFPIKKLDKSKRVCNNSRVEHSTKVKK